MAEFNITHLEKIERRLALLDKVNTLGQAISASLDFESLLQVVTTRVTSILSCYTAVVAFVEGDTVTMQTIIYSQDSEPQRISNTCHIDDHPSIILKAIRELKIQNVPDVTQSPDYSYEPGLDATRSEIAVPLIYREQVIGAFDVQSQTPNAFGPDEVYALKALAPMLAIALVNIRLYTAERRRAEHLRLVNEVTSDMTRILDLPQLVDAVARRIELALGHYHAAVALIDEQQLIFIHDSASEPVADNYPTQLPIDTNNRLGLVAKHEWPVIVQDMRAETGGAAYPCLPNTRAAIAVPLRSRGRVVGVIDVQSEQTGVFERENIELIEALCGQLGTVIENARLFDSLNQEREALETLSQLKDDLTTMIVHDLRAPLSVLQLSLERAVYGTPNPERQQRIVGLALSSISRMTGMVDNMLDITRLETGQLQLHLADTDLLQLLTDVVETLRLEAERERKELRLILPPSLPNVVIDRALTERVVVNLISNALKYSPPNSTIIIQGKSHNAYLQVQIIDEGDGIPADYLPRVFDKYVRAADDHGQRSTGIGLGLTFCRMVVEAHQGRISVRSKLGEGSTFTFELPYTPPKMSA